MWIWDAELLCGGGAVLWIINLYKNIRLTENDKLV